MCLISYLQRVYGSTNHTYARTYVGSCIDAFFWLRWMEAHQARLHIASWLSCVASSDRTTLFFQVPVTCSFISARLDYYYGCQILMKAYKHQTKTEERGSLIGREPTTEDESRTRTGELMMMMTTMIFQRTKHTKSSYY